MTSNIRISKLAFRHISILTIVINGFLAFIFLLEFYKIVILNQTNEYHFGEEGPYYYKTSEIYARECLICGLLFLSTLIYSIRVIMKGQRKSMVLTFGATLFFVFVMFIQGLIEK